VNKKVLAVLRAGLKVILCVGEPLSVRRKGLAAAKRFVRSQLQKNLKGVRSLRITHYTLLVAYEPIWAISSRSGGKSDTPKKSS